MNKKILNILKRNKLFVEYIRIGKNKMSVGEYRKWGESSKIINEVAVDLLEDFLLSQGTSLDILLQETKNYSPIYSKEELREKLWPCWQYINFALHWKTTKQGITYWKNLHNKWVEYVTTIILQDTLDISKFNINAFINLLRMP